VFGFRGDVADNVAYAEDGSVVYPAGHNIVLYSADTKTQRLISGTLESEGITAMCVSANKKLLAVAERSEKAMITVYDLQTLKRRKVLMSTDAGSKVQQTGLGAHRGHGSCMMASLGGVLLDVFRCAHGMHVFTLKPHPTPLMHANQPLTLPCNRST
jgi:hypothetical protein